MPLRLFGFLVSCLQRPLVLSGVPRCRVWGPIIAIIILTTVIVIAITITNLGITISNFTTDCQRSVASPAFFANASGFYPKPQMFP